MGLLTLPAVIHGNEPNTSAILAEDCAAVGGIFIAGTALGLSIYTGRSLGLIT